MTDARSWLLVFAVLAVAGCGRREPSRAAEGSATASATIDAAAPVPDARSETRSAILGRCQSDVCPKLAVCKIGRWFDDCLALCAQLIDSPAYRAAFGCVTQIGNCDELSHCVRRPYPVDPDTALAATRDWLEALRRKDLALLLSSSALPLTVFVSSNEPSACHEPARIVIEHANQVRRLRCLFDRLGEIDEPEAWLLNWDNVFPDVTMLTEIGEAPPGDALTEIGRTADRSFVVVTTSASADYEYRLIAAVRADGKPDLVLIHVESMAGP